MRAPWLVISITHAPYVTRVHCWDIMYAAYVIGTRAQFKIHYIKEIKELEQSAEKHESSAGASRTSRVFLKIPKCLDNSTMLEESVFLLLYFQCKLAIGELLRSELKFFKQKEQKYRQVIMSSIKSSVT